MSITVATIKRVRERTGVNLGTILSDHMQPLSDLIQDPESLVNVMHAICCEDESKDVFELADGLCGDAFEKAIDAFMEALIDFFPNRQSNLLSHAMKSNDRASNALTEAIIKKMDEIESQIVTKLASVSQESSE